MINYMGYCMLISDAFDFELKSKFVDNAGMLNKDCHLEAGCFFRFYM